MTKSEPPRRIYGLPGPTVDSKSLAANGDPANQIGIPPTPTAAKQSPQFETKKAVVIRPELIPAPRLVKLPPRKDGLRFFEPDDVGLKLLTVANRVRVAEVQPNSPPAKAGLRANDILLSLDGSAVDSLESARAQLRHVFVLGGAEFGILRDGKPITLPVSFFGWELPPVEKP